MSAKKQNKVRKMQGVKPGKGSAGRADARHHLEKRAQRPPVSEAHFTGFGDVGRACSRWLMANDPLYRGERLRVEREEAARKARRMAEADAGGDR